MRIHFVQRLDKVDSIFCIPQRWVLKKSEFLFSQKGMVITMERLSVDQIIEIIGSDSMMKEAIEQLPLNLQIKDLTGFLNLPESTVYKLTKLPDFPHIEIGIVKFLVPRPLFLDWYYGNCLYSVKV